MHSFRRSMEVAGWKAHNLVPTDARFLARCCRGGYFPDFTLILKNRQLTKVRFTILLLSGPVRIKPGENERLHERGNWHAKGYIRCRMFLGCRGHVPPASGRALNPRRLHRRAYPESHL